MFWCFVLIRSALLLSSVFVSDLTGQHFLLKTVYNVWLFTFIVMCRMWFLILVPNQLHFLSVHKYTRDFCHLANNRLCQQYSICGRNCGVFKVARFVFGFGRVILYTFCDCAGIVHSAYMRRNFNLTKCYHPWII